MQNQNRINPKVTASVFATGLLSFSGVIVETSMNVSFPTLIEHFSRQHCHCAVDDYFIHVSSGHYCATVICFEAVV